jgi:hypothetical protein
MNKLLYNLLHRVFLTLMVVARYDALYAVANTLSSKIKNKNKQTNE